MAPTGEAAGGVMMVPRDATWTGGATMMDWTVGVSLASAAAVERPTTSTSISSSAAVSEPWPPQSSSTTVPPTVSLSFTLLPAPLPEFLDDPLLEPLAFLAASLLKASLHRSLVHSHRRGYDR